MELAGKTIVITGAASGVGAAAAARFAGAGASVVLTDIDDAGLRAVAHPLDAAFLAGDICTEETVRSVARIARERHGRIDVWFSNAGWSGGRDGSGLPTDGLWQRLWELHVMAHVRAVREVAPEMLARGEGYLLQTASAVALAMQVEKAAYTVTKHAALGLNEWLAANLRPRGVRVSCFCPGGMDTRMLRETLPLGHPSYRTALTMDQVTDILVAGVEAEKFLIDNHGPADGAELLRRKVEDYEGWLDLFAVPPDRPLWGRA